MREFVIMDSIEDEDLTIVAEDLLASNMALLQYLKNRGLDICVLKRQIIDRTRTYDMANDLYLVLKGLDHFDAWLKKACEKRGKQPVIRYIDSLDDEAVAEWAADFMPKELWTYHVSHKYYDEFYRSGPTIRAYDVTMRHFAPIVYEEKDSPDYAEFRDAGYLSARVIREEEIE